MSSRQDVIRALKSVRSKISPIVRFNLDKVFTFDFTEENKELQNIDIADTKKFSEYIFRKMRECNVPVAIGRYNESRTIYAISKLFNSCDTATKEPRTVHLGIDIWAKAETPLFAPLSGKIHSFKNNTTFGDYGPTIILEHNVNNITFYTLYGHLSTGSIEGMHVGQEFNAGDEIARIGNYPENGSWPPHLHFQLITDMQGRKGDFPGVASISEREKFLELCPDPNIMLGIKNLI